MIKVVKAFAVLNDGYTSRKEAEKALSGWEHKEDIKEGFAIVGDDQWYNDSSFEVTFIFNTEKEAVKELKEMQG